MDGLRETGFGVTRPGARGRIDMRRRRAGETPRTKPDSLAADKAHGDRPCRECLRGAGDSGAARDCLSRLIARDKSEPTQADP